MFYGITKEDFKRSVKTGLLASIFIAIAMAIASKLVLSGYDFWTTVSIGAMIGIAIPIIAICTQYCQGEKDDSSYWDKLLALSIYAIGFFILFAYIWWLKTIFVDERSFLIIQPISAGLIAGGILGFISVHRNNTAVISILVMGYFAMIGWGGISLIFFGYIAGILATCLILSFVSTSLLIIWLWNMEKKKRMDTIIIFSMTIAIISILTWGICHFGITGVLERASAGLSTMR